MLKPTPVETCDVYLLPTFWFLPARAAVHSGFASCYALDSNSLACSVLLPVGVRPAGMLIHDVLLPPHTAQPQIHLQLSIVHVSRSAVCHSCLDCLYGCARGCNTPSCSSLPFVLCVLPICRSVKALLSLQSCIRRCHTQSSYPPPTALYMALCCTMTYVCCCCYCCQCTGLLCPSLLCSAAIDGATLSLAAV